MKIKMWCLGNRKTAMAPMKLVKIGALSDTKEYIEVVGFARKADLLQAVELERGDEIRRIDWEW